MQSGGFSLQQLIDQVSKEKGIDPRVLTETMEQAILTAAKRTFGMNRELEARYNPDTGNVDLFQYMTVVDDVGDEERQLSVEDARRHGLEAEIGEELGFQVFYLPEDTDKARQQDKEFGDLLKMQQHRRGFGRIAAQTAKQVIIQRMREAERELVFNEFKDRRGELITGIVRRFERGSNIIVDLGRTEAILPAREQTPRESYRPGDRIVALLKDIDREARGPQIILSRTDVGLLVKLFEMEVPEIYEGIVKIVAAAREPGARSKIAVTSRDSDVDPVGACVGMKGSRVQAVVQELRGEKIDIVPWDRDPARFVCNAIAPAEVSRVIIDEGATQMELVVPDAKLSLAIGRRGQNVRLASQLTGWKLDIISDTRFRQIEDQAMTALSMIGSVDENVAKALYRAGFRSIDEILEASDQEIASIEGVGSERRAAQIKADALAASEGYRKRLVDEAIDRAEPLSEREMLLLVGGISERVADALERGGYKSAADVQRETDVDRLAIKTGLGNQRAREIKDAVARFVEEDLERIRRAQRERAAARLLGPAEGEGGEQEGSLEG
ncbi:transcription termination factor NusA [Sandaracinus amylolyticus]|uniref:transcription termination factor NusA n=1 Tax=Sandaracinus amylolyticus TaxID=927083 RepID=UPI001F017718|nr:transcription termination factor NusA [Sandaracinus amylolyticus]UJR81139.1 Transcription termination factor NusA [Sandaracinus amylolyticus]